MKSIYITLIIALQIVLFASCHSKGELVGVAYSKREYKKSTTYYLEKKAVNISSFNFKIDSIITRGKIRHSIVHLPDCFIFDTKGNRIQKSDPVECINNKHFKNIKLEGEKYNDYDLSGFFDILESIGDKSPDKFQFSDENYHIFITHNLYYLFVENETIPELENWLKLMAKEKCNVHIYLIYPPKENPTFY